MSHDITTENGAEVTVYADSSGVLTLTRFGSLVGEQHNSHVPADYAIDTFVSA